MEELYDALCSSLHNATLHTVRLMGATQQWSVYKTAALAITELAKENKRLEELNARLMEEKCTECKRHKNNGNLSDTTGLTI